MDISSLINKVKGAKKSKEEKQKEIEKKSALMEDSLNKIEKELYITDNDNYDFEIVCPYCNYQFETEFDENQKEVKCPECNNVIELDWSCDDDCEDHCGDGCDSCSGCGHHHDTDQDLEDDM